MAVDPKDIKIIDVEIEGDECSVEFLVGESNDSEGFTCPRTEIENMTTEQLKAHIAKNYASEPPAEIRTRAIALQSLRDLFGPDNFTLLDRGDLNGIFRFLANDYTWSGAISEETVHGYAVSLAYEDSLVNPHDWPEMPEDATEDQRMDAAAEHVDSQGLDRFLTQGDYIVTDEGYIYWMS